MFDRMIDKHLRKEDLIYSSVASVACCENVSSKSITWDALRVSNNTTEKDEQEKIKAEEETGHPHPRFTY